MISSLVIVVTLLGALLFLLYFYLLDGSLFVSSPSLSLYLLPHKLFFGLSESSLLPVRFARLKLV